MSKKYKCRPNFLMHIIVTKKKKSSVRTCHTFPDWNARDTFAKLKLD